MRPEQQAQTTVWSKSTVPGEEVVVWKLNFLREMPNDTFWYLYNAVELRSVIDAVPPPPPPTAHTTPQNKKNTQRAKQKKKRRNTGR
jgi:hypothetical protein